MIERSTTEHGRTLVTFRLPKTVVDAEDLGDVEVVASVVGDFNEWTPGADPLEPEGDDLVAHLELDWGQRYRFRYLLADGRWENDHDADGYEPNDHGGEDGILDLT